MKVQDVMTREPEVISPDKTVQEAAEKMKALNVGMLPVLQGDRLVGMITDRDITVRATVSGADPRTIRVLDALTPEVIYCFEDQDVSEAAQLMKDNQIRRVAVLNHDKVLVGMVSLADLAVLSDSRQAAGDALAAVSEPAEPRRGPFSGLGE